MTSLASLYTDEDMSALVATLLRSRGLDVTYEVARRIGILVVAVKFRTNQKSVVICVE